MLPAPKTAASPPLAAQLVQRIAQDGPLSVADYMEICLADPDNGYYRTRDPLGERGDFTTAPEVCQIFGELIGLWSVEAWRGMGLAGPFQLVELGPGRGTLMADALRAARIVPAFVANAKIHLVETSPVLRAVQHRTLATHNPEWHESLHTLPEGPAIVIGNEFLDALPVRQYVRRGRQWHERRVGCTANGDLAFLEAAGQPLGIPAAAAKAAREGDIVEVRPKTRQLMEALAARAADWPMAALFIDYGHLRSAPGDTFQAVSAHGYADPLAAPGEQDLTAHVDFAALGDEARQAGLAVWGPLEQGAFLLSLGLAQRCEALMKTAGPDGAQRIEQGARRLVEPEEMGALFKAIAVCGGTDFRPPPFNADNS